MAPRGPCQATIPSERARTIAGCRLRRQEPACSTADTQHLRPPPSLPPCLEVHPQGIHAQAFRKGMGLIVQRNHHGILDPGSQHLHGEGAWIGLPGLGTLVHPEYCDRRPSSRSPPLTFSIQNRSIPSSCARFLLLTATRTSLLMDTCMTRAWRGPGMRRALNVHWICGFP